MDGVIVKVMVIDTLHSRRASFFTDFLFEAIIRERFFIVQRESGL